MGPRMEYFIKKTRPFQLLFVAVAVLCLLVFLVFNFLLNDRHGSFEGHAEVHQELEIPMSRDGLETVTIEAGEAKVEVGMASSLGKPMVTVSGRGCTNQLAKVDLTGTHCDIVLEGDASNAKELTLQIPLPQDNLTKVDIITSGDTNLNVDTLRTAALNIETEAGYANINNVKAKSLSVSAQTAPIRMTNNKISQVSMTVEDASVTMLENSFEKVTGESQNGNIFAYNKRLKGDWTLTSMGGELTLLSSNLPYNVLIDALSGDGGVDMTYTKRFWKDAEVVASDENTYKGSVGTTPNKIVELTSGFGKVTVGQRGRFDNLDPYAKDYPYANENPYTIERSTITK